MPETRYAHNGDVSIAYQCFGKGPNLLTVPPAAQNIEVAWENPQIRHMLQTFGSFSRYVHFDKRGTGMSDPSLEVPSLDERVADMNAVVDDLNLGQHFVFGASEGGPMALFYAATYPERVLGLVLQASAATWTPRFPDHPWGYAADAEWLERYRSNWGTSQSVTLERFGPSLHADEAFRKWWPRYERLSASPAALRRVGAMIRDIDARAILPTVRVPTLVLHRKGDRVVPIQSGRYLAEHIPGARLVELEGDDHLGYGGDQDAWLDETREFVTGTRRPTEPDRLLATVLFTDLVDSTGQASRLGDRRWGELLSRPRRRKGQRVWRAAGQEPAAHAVSLPERSAPQASKPHRSTRAARRPPRPDRSSHARHRNRRSPARGCSARAGGSCVRSNGQPGQWH